MALVSPACRCWPSPCSWGESYPRRSCILTLVSLAVCLLGCSWPSPSRCGRRQDPRSADGHLRPWAVWLLAARSGLGVGTFQGSWLRSSGLVLQAQPVRPRFRGPYEAGIHGCRCRRVCDLGPVYVDRDGAFAVSILNLRPERFPPGASERSEQAVERARRRVEPQLFSWWPSPSLDGNPVLWREWHRDGPSRMARLIISTLFIAGTAIAVAVGITEATQHGVVRNGTGLLVGVNMLASAWSPAALSATTPTTLTEERSGGAWTS